MANDEDKPVVQEFDANGRRYRAEEWKSHMGATVTDVLTGEKTLDQWPHGARQKYGSTIMINVTIDFVKSYIDGIVRLRAINGAIADKALEDERRNVASGQTNDP